VDGLYGHRAPASVDQILQGLAGHLEVDGATPERGGGDEQDEGPLQLADVRADAAGDEQRTVFLEQAVIGLCLGRQDRDLGRAVVCRGWAAARGARGADARAWEARGEGSRSSGRLASAPRRARWRYGRPPPACARSRR